jgi:hypothetical protein
MVMRVGCANEGEARQRPGPFDAGLRCGRNRRRRWQGPRHGQASHAAIIDTDFAAAAVGRARRLIRDAAVAENAGRRGGFGRNLRCAKARNEA